MIPVLHDNLNTHDWSKICRTSKYIEISQKAKNKVCFQTSKSWQVFRNLILVHVYNDDSKWESLEKNEQFVCESETSSL